MIPDFAFLADATQGAWPFLKATGKFIGICLEVILLFNLLIFIHELGHFLAARWRGLYVEEFALWFGKPLWRKKIGGVWYAINSIPAGGYVKLPQMAPMEALEGGAEALPEEAKRPISPLDKIIVAFAGPLFSFLLAFAMATAVWVVGKPVTTADAPVIGETIAGGPAERDGLKPGDEVMEVDGKRVTHFASGTNSVLWAVMRSEGEKIPFVVKRDGAVQPPIYVGWVKEQTDGWRPALRKVMIRNRVVPEVDLVQPKSNGGKAGLKQGDIITSIDGKPVADMNEVREIVFANFAKTVPLTVKRTENNATKELNLELEIPPKPANENIPLELGVEFGRTFLDYPDPWTQVRDAATTIFRMVDALLSPKSDVRAAHFSGPVGILRLYYRVFDSPDGWRHALALSVLINVNLALLNMLPFPVLDGGHITLAIVEAIRRKPLNVRVLEVLQTTCALLLIGFMLFVTFYDLGDIVGGRKKAPTPAKVEEVATPAPTAPPTTPPTGQ